MSYERWLGAALALSLLAGLLLISPPAVASPSDAMAVDAIPGGGVDPQRVVTGTDRFDVDISVTDASTPYQGYTFALRWDPAVLAYDGYTDLMPADLTICGPTQAAADWAGAGCVRATGEITFTGPVTRVSLHCVANGTSPLHLVTLEENPAFGTSTLAQVGFFVDTVLVDAQITCTAAGGPGPTATPGGGGTPTPGPGATPTPLPPGMEMAPLVSGCQFLAWTGADGTMPEELARQVGPAENLLSFWAQQPPPTWRGYSPEFPQVSDMGPMDMLDVVAICMMGPGNFIRPLL